MNLLSKNQYKTLMGIAKENKVKSVRTKYFTNKYKLASSTANQALNHLVDKEIVYEKSTKDGNDTWFMMFSSIGGYRRTGKLLLHPDFLIRNTIIRLFKYIIQIEFRAFQNR